MQSTLQEGCIVFNVLELPLEYLLRSTTRSRPLQERHDLLHHHPPIIPLCQCRRDRKDGLKPSDKPRLVCHADLHLHLTIL